MANATASDATRQDNQGGIGGGGLLALAAIGIGGAALWYESHKTTTPGRQPLALAERRLLPLPLGNSLGPDPSAECVPRPTRDTGSGHPASSPSAPTFTRRPPLCQIGRNRRDLGGATATMLWEFIGFGVLTRTPSWRCLRWSSPSSDPPAVIPSPTPATTTAPQGPGITC